MQKVLNIDVWKGRRLRERPPLSQKQQNCEIKHSGSDFSDNPCIPLSTLWVLITDDAYLAVTCLRDGILHFASRQKNASLWNKPETGEHFDSENSDHQLGLWRAGKVASRGMCLHFRTSVYKFTPWVGVREKSGRRYEGVRVYKLGDFWPDYISD